MRISDWSSDVCSSDLQRFEPISLLAGVASDFADLGNYMTPEESDRFALNLSIAVAKNITSKTWLSGLSDFFDVLSDPERRSEEHTSELQSLMRISYAVFCLKKKKPRHRPPTKNKSQQHIITN